MIIILALHILSNVQLALDVTLWMISFGPASYYKKFPTGFPNQAIAAGEQKIGSNYLIINDVIKAANN